METLQVGKAGLAHIIHDGLWRNRAVATRDRCAEPRRGALHRLGVPKGVRPLRGDSTRGLDPLVGVGEAGFRAEPATEGRHT
jgi:hypothetical protein